MDNIVKLDNMEMDKVVSDLINVAVKYGLKLIAAVIILMLGFWITKRLTRSAKRIMDRRDVDLSLRSFLVSLVNISLKIVTIVIVLTSVGVEMTSIVAILGAASLAIGMALSGTLQNFAGGVVILLMKPFKVGDVIENQTQHTGTVASINIFTTQIKTADNKTIFIPNGTLANGIIINYTREGTRRLEIVISIAYGDDMDKARLLLNELINADSRILQDPPPIVFLGQMAANSINITIRVWVKSDDFLAVQYGLTEKIYETLPQKGFSFPFPQVQVHFDKKENTK